MSKSTKILVAVISLIIVIGTLAFFVLKGENETKSTNNKSTDSSTSVKTDKPQQEPASTLAQGRYTDYSQKNLADSNYSTTVVFFYAPWCPECRAFKSAITEGQIPDGVQVLETDFDSSTDLKKQYGVTLQSTFVRVDSSGDLQKKWVGYGQDKSLNNVLESLK